MLGAPRLPAEQALLAQRSARRRGDTVEEGYRAAWEAGSGLALEAAVEDVILQVAAQPVLREP